MGAAARARMGERWFLQVNECKHSTGLQSRVPVWAGWQVTAVPHGRARAGLRSWQSGWSAEGWVVIPCQLLAHQERQLTRGDLSGVVARDCAAPTDGLGGAWGVR